MQAIVFDLDETLIDRSLAVKHFSEILWEEFLRDSTMSLSAFVAKVKELDGNGYVARDVFFEYMMSSFPGVFPSRATVEKHFYGEVWETPQLAGGVVEMLSALKEKNIPLGIVTNGSTKAQRAKISSSGLSDFIDVVIISEAFGAKKPDSSIFEAVAAELGIAPADSWFVGDHPVNDVWGSKQVGFSTAWIHLNRPWSREIECCYDVAEETFSEVMTEILRR